MESKVAKDWMESLASTTNAKDLNAHMDLVSKRVRVHGVPGIELIDYNDWETQCKYEFENNILKCFSYEGLKTLVMTPERVMFKTKEVIEDTDGSVQSRGIEILLEKEEDQKWRVVQERIMSPDEMEFDARRH
jgi:hypothetical protein